MSSPAPEMQNSLLMDYGGLIEEIAICIPRPIASISNHPKLEAYAHLLRAMPAEVSVLIIYHERNTIIPNWVSTLGVTAKTTTILVKGQEDLRYTSSMWIQDEVLVSQCHYLDIIGEGPANPGHPRWLAGHDGTPVVVRDINLPGGNILVGSDFRIVGADSINRDADNRMGAIAQDNALKEHQDFDPRPMHIYGYRRADLPLRSQSWWSRIASTIRNEQWRTRYQRATSPGQLFPELYHLLRALAAQWRRGFALSQTVQAPFHLDLALAPTGCRTTNGEPVLLLADPRGGHGLNAPRDPVHGDHLDAIALVLSNYGLRILRNQVPAVNGTDFHGPFPPPRSYNNVLVENVVRSGAKPNVWVPQFADGDPQLTQFDAYNLEIWRVLGFDPRPVAGWTSTAYSMGALRCACKVLRRGPPEAIERVIDEETLAKVASLADKYA